MTTIKMNELTPEVKGFVEEVIMNYMLTKRKYIKHEKDSYIHKKAIEAGIVSKSTKGVKTSMFDTAFYIENMRGTTIYRIVPDEGRYMDYNQIIGVI